MLAARSFPEPVGYSRVKSDDVRFGSEADIGAFVKDVRFTPESGHSQADCGGSQPALFAPRSCGSLGSVSVEPRFDAA